MFGVLIQKAWALKDNVVLIFFLVLALVIAVPFSQAHFSSFSEFHTHIYVLRIMKAIWFSVFFCAEKSLDWIIMHFYEASIKFDLKMKNFNALIVSADRTSEARNMNEKEKYFSMNEKEKLRPSP